MPLKDLALREEYHKKYNADWYLRAKTRHSKQCLHCHKDFQTRYEKQLYCSAKCFGLHIRNVTKCKACSRVFSAPPSKKRIFCGHSCASTGRKIVIKDKAEWHKKFGEGLLRRDNSKLKSILRDEKASKNRNWKGDGVKYKGLHMWVGNNYPKQGFCEHCRLEKKTHWANRSGKYLRDREDWIELCPTCHKRYDDLHCKPCTKLPTIILWQPK